MGRNQVDETEEPTAQDDGGHGGGGLSGVVKKAGIVLIGAKLAKEGAGYALRQLHPKKKPKTGAVAAKSAALGSVAGTLLTNDFARDQIAKGLLRIADATRPANSNKSSKSSGKSRSSSGSKRNAKSRS